MAQICVLGPKELSVVQNILYKSTVCTIYVRAVFADVVTVILLMKFKQYLSQCFMLYVLQIFCAAQIARSDIPGLTCSEQCREKGG